MTSAKALAERDVSVFGTDAFGKPFNQAARVISIDGFEVAIEGLACTLDLNNIVGVRHAGQKARFLVLWIGRNGTPQQGQVGLRALEPEKDIWRAKANGQQPGAAKY